MTERGAGPPERRPGAEKRAAQDAETPPHYAGHRDRLRERFLTQGAGSLADYEILELLLFSAIPRRDVKPLAKRLIAQFGSLGGVLNAAPGELEQRGGLTTAAVALLKIVAAASVRMLREEVAGRPVIGSWAKLLDYVQLALRHETIERLHLLFLDKKNVLIADEIQQSGTVDHTPVYPREVVKRALALSASAVIMVHNHPSGDVTPSQADIAMTREVAKALATVDIALHDHLIVGRSGHASFKALGLL